MKKSRFIPVLLAFVMLITCTLSPTQKAKAYDTPLIIGVGEGGFDSGNVVYANPGDSVTIKVYIALNPGICTLYTEVEYDPKLTLTNVEDLGLLKGPVFGGDYSENPFNLTWDDSTAKTDNTNDGIVAALTFTVSEDAEPGDELCVSVNVTDCYNLNMDDVDCEEYSGSIFIVAGEHDHIWGEPSYDYNYHQDNGDIVIDYCYAMAYCNVKGCLESEYEDGELASIESSGGSCTEPGINTYTFEFENFAPYSFDIEGDCLGHDYTGELEYDWTVTADGTAECTAKLICAREGCGEVLAEETATIENGKITCEETPAACGVAGKCEYTATFDSEYLLNYFYNVVIPALEHDATGTPVYEWEEDGKSCTAQLICARENCEVVLDEETVTFGDGITGEVTTPATCGHKGITTYTATFENLGTDTKDVEDVDGLEHIGTVAYDWSDDGKQCIATLDCTREGCGEHVEETATVANGKISVAEKTAATCEGVGTNTYTATFANTVLGTSSKDVDDIEALGHDYGEVSLEWTDLECTASVTCKRDGCNHTETETVTGVQSGSAPATCETAGTITYTATFTKDLFKNVNDTKTVTNTDAPALGHNWNEISYTWFQDMSKCNASVTCKRCNFNVAEEVEPTIQETAPTCTEKGEKKYTATFTKEPFTTQTEIVEIEALGHDYGEVSMMWDEDLNCTASTTCTREGCNHTVTETVAGEEYYRVPADCEFPGYIYYEAQFTKEEFGNDNYSFNGIVDPEDPEALGHLYGEPDYVWEDDGSKCVATISCTREGCEYEVTEEGTITSNVTTQPTCESKGITTYTATFENDLFSTRTKDIENVEALGHLYGTPEYDWEDDYSGCTARVSCTREGCTHVETETVNASVDTVPATCEAAGSVTYTANFTNSLFTSQSKTVDGDAALDHDYGTPEYTWTNDGKSCTATVTCTRTGCEDTITETVNSVGVVTTPATDDTVGTTTYTATFTNSLFTPQEKKVDNIPALGHKYGTPEYSWSEDGKTCTATAKCTTEGCTDTVTETVNAVANVTTAATCEGKGITTYTATFASSLFTAQTKDVEDIAALGHKYGTPEYSWSEDGKTCTAKVSCVNSGCTDEITEAATISSEVTQEASPIRKGTTTYTAHFTNKLFETQTKSVADIDYVRPQGPTGNQGSGSSSGSGNSGSSSGSGNNGGSTVVAQPTNSGNTNSTQNGTGSNSTNTENKNEVVINADGSTTSREVSEDENGSVITKEVTEQTNGTVTTVETTENKDGSVVKDEKTEFADGSIKESTTVEALDGTVTSTTIFTGKDGAVTTSESTTTKDEKGNTVISTLTKSDDGLETKTETVSVNGIATTTGVTTDKDNNVIETFEEKHEKSFGYETVTSTSVDDKGTVTESEEIIYDSGKSVKNSTSLETDGTVVKTTEMTYGDGTYESTSIAVSTDDSVTITEESKDENGKTEIFTYETDVEAIEEAVANGTSIPVALTGIKSNEKNVVIDSELEAQGQNVQVTTLAKNAINSKKTRTVEFTVGTGAVNKILKGAVGKKAKKLKNVKIRVKSNKDAKALVIDKNAFSNLQPDGKVTIVTNSKKAFKTIKKALKKSGISGNISIKMSSK